MSNRIKLSELRRQSDSVWSTQDPAEIDGFVRSGYFKQVANAQDLSSLNTGLIKQPGLDEELQLSHLRANFLRAFNWNAQSRVLEIGSAAGSITRFLAEQNLNVDAIESNRALAQVGALRTQDFTQVRVICEPFAGLDFESEKYDAIVLTGITDYAISLLGDVGLSFQQALAKFLSDCQRLLSSQGRIYLAADNSHGIKYAFGTFDERTVKPYFGYQLGENLELKQTLNLFQWRQLLSQISFQYIDEYYLFPDFRFPQVLLGQKYTETNQYAFQHLEGICSKSYYHLLDIGISEFLIYQASSNHGHLGEWANSCLFVLGNDKSDGRDSIDFVHFPNFHRRKEYLSIVKKQSCDDFVKRIRVIEDQIITENKIKQDFQAEQYVHGCLLSILWQRCILHDSRDIKFEQYLLEYFDFLKKLESGILQGINIDAIANNVIVDDEGRYHLIDHEWQLLDEPIDIVYIFYRAMVHFAWRNLPIIHQFKWVNTLTTISDFLFYCFKTIGIKLTRVDLERMRVRDYEFQTAVINNPKEYQLSDALGYLVENERATTYIKWRYYDEKYKQLQTLVCLANATYDAQQLIFRLPRAKQSIDCFRFFPFEHLESSMVGYFDIQSLTVKAIDEFNNQRVIWNLNSSEQINDANIHEGIFYGKKQLDSVFMFGNNDTFLEFKLPNYNLNNKEELEIEIFLRLTPSHDYEIARYQFGLAHRVTDEILRLREDEFITLYKELEELKNKFNEVQNSRVWRLLIAYRDSFIHTGYPKKNFFGKLSQLIRRYKNSE